MDDRTPVIIGVGQVNGADGAEEPLDLVEAAARRAIADAGGATPPVDVVALTKIGTRAHHNAPAALAARLDRPEARTLQARHGGHTAQTILAHLATEIAVGRCDAALLAGGELGSAIKQGRFESDDGTPGRDAASESPAPSPEIALGDDLGQWLAHPQEAALGIDEPITMYPVLETALGHALGRTRDEHLAAVARLWADFAAVAANNPYADDRTGYDAKTISTAGPGNRYVGYPYTKLMNSNQFVDQGAAVLLCSAGVARRLGVARDRQVFPIASAGAHSAFVSERGALHDAPALTMAGRAVEAMIGRPLAEVEIVDLYACFPFAVQAQALALGLGLDRPLTVTGGMRFAGGPWNNYGMHMMANLVANVREQPEAIAIGSTNGGIATRFCVNAYAGAPAADGFRALPAPISDPTRRRRLETRPTGAATIEGYTVRHDRRNEPVDAIAACLLSDGARAWARLERGDDVQALLDADPIGRTVRFEAVGPRLD